MKRQQLKKFAIGLVVLGPWMAHADTANVNVYGTLNLDMESVKATGATNNNSNYVNRLRLSSNSSNFGLKGIEELNNAMKAVYQVELGVNLSNGAFTNTVSGSVIGLRNSMIGISGNFGTVSYGIWDTPFKIMNAAIDPWYSTGVGYMGAVANTVGQGGVATTMATTGTTATGNGNTGERSSFDRRQGNNVQYWSPTVYNTTFRFMYSANADRSANTASTAGDPYLWDAALTYDDGAAYVGFSYEEHNDFFAGIPAPVTGVTGTSSKDTGYKVAARYKFPFGLSFGGFWDSLKYRQTAAAGDSSYSRGSLTFVATQAIDDWTIRAGYAHATDGTCNLATGAACDVSGLGATQMTIGGSYTMGKRTDVYALFSKIWNGNSDYNFVYNSLNSTSTAPMPAGADPQAFGLGIRHTF